MSAFVGNLWALINPWRTIFETVETLYRGISGRPELSLRVSYPTALGVWPAFVLLLAFAWFELIYPNPAMPRLIAWLAVAYSVLTFTGMFVFGRERWLAHGEVFTLIFGTFARFAPLEVRAGPQRELSLRPFGAGLLDSSGVSTSMMAFVLLLLATVLYDGALGTPEWGTLESALAAHLPGFGDGKLMAIRTAGLLAFWLVFFGAYVGVSALMSAVTAGRLSPLAMARQFAFTLVPIAIGYHLAHYLTFLLIQGQYIIPLASDPFGFGWNLFGTAGYRVDIAIVDARFAWYAAVTRDPARPHRGGLSGASQGDRGARTPQPGAALAGPAHRAHGGLHFRQPHHSGRADRRAPRARAAVADQRRDQRPADAVLPEPGSGRLRPVGEGKIAKQKLTYRAMGSAFHDGTRTSGADLLYAYMFAYRWGARGEAQTRPSIRWSRRQPPSCARSFWACDSSAPTARRSRFGSATSRSCASCSSSRSTPRRRRSIRSRMRWSRRPGARCPGMCWC